MKYSLKIKNIMFKSKFMSLLKRITTNKKTAILRYHAVVSPENNYYSSHYIAISPDDFEKQVQFLSKNYNVISLDTIADCINHNKKFPDKSVVLTFDDGYKDNFLAYQIMKQYGVHGTFYIVAGCIGQKETLWLFEIIYLIKKTQNPSLSLKISDKKIILPLTSAFEKTYAINKITQIIKSHNLKIREHIRNQLQTQIQDVLDFHEKASQVMLNWEQVKEMSDNGMTIGGHTMTHLNLPNADYKDAKREIYECKKLIEEKTGKPVLHFSYPNGGNYDYYNDTIKNIVKDSGYKTSTTSNNGLADKNSDVFELQRIRITPNLSEVMYQIECEPVIKSCFKILRKY